MKRSRKSRQPRLAMKSTGSIRSSSAPRVRKLDVLLVLVVIGWGSCRYLQEHPIELNAPEPAEAAGQPRPGSERADVLLVTAPPTSSPETFADMSFGANWRNILSQEFGPHRVIDLDDFGPSSLADTALVIVTRDAARRATPGSVATLEQWVHDGGRLLVEMPLSGWSAVLGANVEPGEIRETRRVTAFDGAMVRGDLRDDVIQAPLRTVMAPVEVGEFGGREDLQVFMEVDGLPALLRRQVGRGEVFALYFDLARAVGVLQQGAPTVDWQVARPAAPLPPGFTRTAALIASSDLRNARSPSADLLERNLLSTVTASRPVPRIWLFPGTAPGAFVMTHSVDGPLAQGRFMLEWESASELPATVFVRASEAREQEGSDALALIDDRGVLLLPPSTPEAPRSELGLFGATLMRRPLPAAEQLADARGAEAAAGGEVVTRVSGGLWDPEYGVSFRQLAALGVDVDASYGPAYAPTEPEGVAGFTFGTGLPFWPVDRNGELLPLLEIPTVLNDGAGLEASTVETFIDRAAGVYNQLIVADWRTSTMHVAPSAEVVRSWRDSFEDAAEHGLWVTDLRSFARFWELRAQSSLSSTFSPAERRLVVRADTAAIEVNGEQVAPSLAFEARYDGHSIERITRNGSDVPFAELGRSADGVFQIFALPPGNNRVEITYQGPVAVPLDRGDDLE
jgi:hypothetical protein